MESHSLSHEQRRPRAVDCHAPHHLGRLVARRAHARAGRLLLRVYAWPGSAFSGAASVCAVSRLFCVAEKQAQADEHQKQLSYWVEQLQSSRPAELLCDKPRPAALSGEAGVQSIEIAGPLYAKLQSFCQLHGVTQFVVLLAAFRATHFRLTGQEDATIGTPNANRDRWEVKDMVGFFVNMQCLRIKIGDESFEELVQQVHEVAVASHANADVPSRTLSRS
ncbi:hypothetical protein P3342_007311 [Pyrenophora teres f. teres]|nr:hypothetical protein P3342_007311 [Pyrenophora teres f. teres]